MYVPDCGVGKAEAMDRKRDPGWVSVCLSLTVHPGPGSEIKPVQQVGGEERAMTREQTPASQLTAPLPNAPSPASTPWSAEQSLRQPSHGPGLASPQRWVLLSSPGYVLTPVGQPLFWGDSREAGLGLL